MMKCKKKPLLLEVMLNGSFICQLEYNRKGTIETTDKGVEEYYLYKDLEEFVLEKRPTLKNKPFKIVGSNQKVL